MGLLISKLFVFFLITISSLSFGNEKNDNQFIIQYAGEIGKYSVGVGNRINKYYSLSAHYGFVPPTEIQNKIETYTLKNNLHIFDTEAYGVGVGGYLGLALFHVPGDKYKTHEHSSTPNDYYRQSSIRGLAYIGADLSYRNNMSIYAESGINDIWIINSINNDSIDYRDHVSLGVGAKYKF